MKRTMTIPGAPIAAGAIPAAGGLARAVLGLALALTAGLQGCGQDRMAGGTIETTNGISARITLPTGHPAAAIKVYLLDEQDWLSKIKSGESLVLDSAETDSAGRFRLGRKPDTARTAGLYADVEGYGVFIHDATQRRLDSEFKGEIGLTRKLDFMGVVEGTGFGARRIFLSGSPFAADVDASGNFRFQGVPAAAYSLVIRRQRPAQPEEYILIARVELDEKSRGSSVIIVPDTVPSLLLEDFEDKDNQNLLAGTWGLRGGLWEATDDGYLGGSTLLTQPVNDGNSNFGNAIQDGGLDTAGDAGHSLEVRYAAGTRPGAGEAFSWASLAINIGQQSMHYNLSGMDSLSFWSRGDGKVVVELLQQNPYPHDVSLSVVASFPIELDSAWREYRIRPSDLRINVGWFPADPASYRDALEQARLPAYTGPPSTWTGMGGMVTQIRFKGTAGSVFWLDQIRLHGVNVGDLVK
jgi:hypothetical protein